MKRRRARWRDRLRDRPAAEFGFVVATPWLPGAAGWSAELLGLEHQWLKSPNGLGA